MSYQYDYISSRVLQGMGFGAIISTPQVAGQFAALQLWNPVGSGKRLVVTSCKLNANSSSTQSLEFALINTQMSGTALALEPAFAGQNNASVMSGVVGTLSTIPTSTALAFGFVNNTQQFYDMLSGNVVAVAPGWGVLFYNLATNIALYGSTRWIEEPL